MNWNNLLNQVLNTVQNKQSHHRSRQSNPLGSLGGSALAAGLAGMFMKKKNTKSLVKIGSMAAIGMLAYKAYQNWQSSNQNVTIPAQNTFEPTGMIAEDQSRIILRAMIAAAASDGLIDDAEKQIILQESSNDPQAQQWLETELNHPATPQALAQAVNGNAALAAEVYLAARIVCADLDRKEIIFLAQLAQALNLDNTLVDHLEQQAGF
ncbi:tellurite resistance TerB family protein [Neisseria weaveri]|uniref:tellurite resistance TerB family protein n=1 Tax=Neisseria weaveri TaxID=28091 RepID=UPI000D31DF9B|nr:DUF533 domain-containing protein [Neisseria weaveri]